MREPLAGRDVTVPIAPHVAHAVTGHRTAASALIHMNDVDGATVDSVLGFDRTVFIPTTALSLSDLEAAVVPLPTPLALRPSPLALHPPPSTLHASRFTLHPSPFTLHPHSHPQPQP